MGAQLLDIVRVECGIFTCEIHLPNNRAARRAVASPSRGSSMGDGDGRGADAEQKGEDTGEYYGNYKQKRCHLGLCRAPIQLQFKRARFWNEQLTLPTLAGSFRALSAPDEDLFRESQRSSP